MSDGFITLADGTRVYKDGRITALEVPTAPVIEHEEEESTTSTALDPSQLLVPQTKRLKDLPETTRTMNGISAILCYTLFGLKDDDIAEAIGTTEERILSIKALPSYTAMRNDVLVNVITAEQSDVRGLFVKHSRHAVKTVVDGMNAKKTADRLRAAGDILDRSGYRPADVVEHRHRLDGGLTIEIVRKDKNVPLFDIAMED